MLLPPTIGMARTAHSPYWLLVLLSGASAAVMAVLFGAAITFTKGRTTPSLGNLVMKSRPLGSALSEGVRNALHSHAGRLQGGAGGGTAKELARGSGCLAGARFGLTRLRARAVGA